jgi:uncharacterized protein (TIGR00369 family)
MTDYATPGRAMLDRALATGQQEFGSFFLSRLLGFTVTYGEGTCTVAFMAEPVLFNPQGTLHGGVLATALDVSMGHLLHHTNGAGATLEMKIQYFAPVTVGQVLCTASFLRAGRSISFLQSHVTRADGELAAHATATWKRLPPKT